jgi:hypothetical protein
LINTCIIFVFRTEVAAIFIFDAEDLLRFVYFYESSEFRTVVFQDYFCALESNEGMDS